MSDKTVRPPDVYPADPTPFLPGAGVIRRCQCVAGASSCLVPLSTLAFIGPCCESNLPTKVLRLNLVQLMFWRGA